MGIRLMDKILHDPKDPKLWELWYIPYNGSCRILSINRRGFLKLGGGSFRGFLSRVSIDDVRTRIRPRSAILTKKLLHFKGLGFRV